MDPPYSINFYFSLQGLYAEECIEFLFEEGDPVDVYEEKGKKHVSQYDQGMQALSNIPRIQQVEVIHGNMLNTFPRESLN